MDEDEDSQEESAQGSDETEEETGGENPEPKMRNGAYYARVHRGNSRRRATKRRRRYGRPFVNPKYWRTAGEGLWRATRGWN
jgi:hypothetical protein